MTEITLKALKDPPNFDQRIDILKLLHRKAEEKVNHLDMYRQRNMNYALVIFAGFSAVGIKLQSHLSQGIVSVTLLALMVIFCIWDRRWHGYRHGWDYSSRVFYERLCAITNEPNNDISYKLYYAEGEVKAEWSSLQPIVFYFLITASVASFFIFRLLNLTP
jgi:hypothetical protein